MAALTLLEAAKVNNGTELEKAVVETFARESDIIRVTPFVNIAGNAIKFNREGSLPTVAFRGVNEAYTANNGSLDTVTDALSIFGGDIDVDKFIIDTMGPDQRTIHRTLKIKAMAASFATKWIKGDNTSSQKEFDGLQRRIGGSQLITNSATSGGAALSLLKLDEAIDTCVAPTHLLMSRAMRRKFIAAARTSTVAGNVVQDRDEFGKPLTIYGGLPIICPFDNALGTEVLTFTEANSGGGSTVGTSIYVLRLGADGVRGLKNGEITVRDMGELQTAPVLRDRVEGYVGQSIADVNAAVRLYSIADAAITA